MDPHPLEGLSAGQHKLPHLVSRSLLVCHLPTWPPTYQKALLSRELTHPRRLIFETGNVKADRSCRFLSELTSGAPSGATVALDSTFTQGVTPTYSGAPATPTGMLTIANYPALDLTPPTDSPEVQEWLSKIDLSGVPSYGPTTGDVSCIILVICSDVC